MDERELNFLQSLKLFFLFGKLFGCITFTYNNEKLVYKKKFFDKILILFHVTIVIYVTKLFIWFILSQFNLVFGNLIYQILKLIYFTTFITNILHGVKNQNKLYEILVKLEKLSSFLKEKQFQTIQNFSIFIYLMHNFCNLVHFALEVCNEDEKFQLVVFFTLTHIALVALEAQMTVLLFITKLLVKDLNNKMKNLDIDICENLKKYMYFHYQLFEICKNINDLYKCFLLVRYCCMFYGLSLTGFYIADILTMSGDLGKTLILFVLWHTSNILSAVFLVHFCDSIKKQVIIIHSTCIC